MTSVWSAVVGNKAVERAGISAQLICRNYCMTGGNFVIPCKQNNVVKHGEKLQQSAVRATINMQLYTSHELGRVATHECCNTSEVICITHDPCRNSH